MSEHRDTLHLETNFETYITRKLKSLKDSGWVVSDSDSTFDPSTALVMDDFIQYFMCKDRIR